MSVCKNCGNSIYEEGTYEEETPRSMGMSLPTCSCPRPVARREPSRRPVARREPARREPTQNITYVSPAPSIADQLAVLAKLRKEGSLTEQEFQTLKTRLISGGKS